MANYFIKAHVVEVFHRYPRQDLSREEIIKFLVEARPNINPETIDRAVSEITETNKLGIFYPEIKRLYNGKFRYEPRLDRATLEPYME